MHKVETKRDQARSAELTEEQLNEVSGGTLGLAVCTSSTSTTSGTIQGGEKASGTVQADLWYGLQR